MPLQLLLISFASCLGGTIAPLFRRMGKKISGLSIKAKGSRHAEHPTSFDRIYLDITVKSENIDKTDVEKVLKLAEDKYCPVWAVIKNNVDVVTAYKIENA